MPGPSASYVLVRPPRAVVTAPVLDPQQRQVVEHPGGPLLVLAGPGTGKTTTLVEAVVHRVEERGLDPEQLLVLTFSRRAAGELRRRITGRLGRTTREPVAMTFHSYAFALLRREAQQRGEPVPRLLSGPEHLLEIRRLLRGDVDDSARDWPAGLRPVLLTRGFADELRDLLLRARERGLDGDALIDLGRRVGREDWVAAGAFLRRYAARFDLDPAGPAYDYAELVHRAAQLLGDHDVRAREQAARAAVFVDEYQDSDPAQEMLLQRLAGGGRDLVAVGDPDQSIYGFRGADVTGVLRFRERFRTADGQEAALVALRHCRRSGPALLAASRRLAHRLPAVPGGRLHRDLKAVDGAPGQVEVRLADSVAGEAAQVADVLRRAHLLDGVPWSRMAVLVRAAGRSIPVLRRALGAAGVPVVVAGDEIPLGAEPGVRPLLQAMRVGLDPASLDESTAAELVTGPLGGADALQLRRLRRALREADGSRAPSGRLLVEALHDPRRLAAARPLVRAPADRVARLLAVVREAAAAGGDAEDVLWALWSASGLSEQWESRSLSGGGEAARADRALDSAVALFEAAARFVDRLPHSSPLMFLDDLQAQEIPADSLAERAPTGDAVRILTAHRSKGLEWDLVVVAGVQEGVWPDLRLRGSLLGAETLVETVNGTDVSGAGLAGVQLAEERRLFYVACTRARERLVVTAVGGSDDSEERPSRFLAELIPAYDEGPLPPAPRPLSLPALVAELRSALCDPARSTRHPAAAETLARLAEAGVPGADPADWYALTELSDDRPPAGPDEPVRVSPSQVEGFVDCGLRWLLERAAGAAGASGAAQGMGNVIHALAALAADPAMADETVLTARLDDVWAHLDLGGRWFSRKQRETAVQWLRTFLAWHRDNARTLVAVEAPFDISSGRVRVSGRVDRLECDDTGRPVVVDLKTGARRPSDEELGRQPQLGVYQLAVALGAFAEIAASTEPGGAELVQVGKSALTSGARVQSQPPLGDDPDPDWVVGLLDEVATGMSAAAFTATVGDGCRSCAVKACCPAQPDGRMVVP